MALENKKSILQPESVEAQQFRLKNSNLAARLDQSISISNQQSSAVGAAPTRPSILAPSTPPTPLPAESNATVSSTVPGGSPTPLPSPVNPAGSPTNTSIGPSAPTQEIVLSDKAADFDGSFFFTASNPDLGFTVPSGSHHVAVMFKPDTFTANHTQTIFHTYSGSFASQSIEMYIAPNGNLNVRYSNKGGYIRYQLAKSAYTPHRTGKQGNGYTFATYFKVPSNVGGRPFGTSENQLMTVNGNYLSAGIKHKNIAQVNTGSFNISNNDHFYIGGTAARSNSNFSGSIAFMFFGDVIPNKIQTGFQDGTLDVSNPPDFNTTRAYKFTNNAATASIEYTGSLATTQMPLGMNVHSSSYTYVDSFK